MSDFLKHMSPAVRERNKHILEPEDKTPKVRHDRPEGEFQGVVIAFTKARGWLCYHTYDSSSVLYAWLATVSAALPRFDFPMYAIMIDSTVYLEFMAQFQIETRENWGRLLDSGVKQLYYWENNTLRRNAAVHQIMCAIGTGLIGRLEEMNLIVPVEKLEGVEMLANSHQQQLVLAALRYHDS